MPKLLERLAGGDREALIRVTRMVTSTLRARGAYDLGEDRADLCQEILSALVLAERAGRAPAEEKVGAFVATVTRNQFVSWLRRRNSRPKLLQASVGDHSDSGSTGNEIEAAAAASIDHSAGSMVERDLAAREALAGLPREWQQLMVARFVEERSIDEIVALTGRSRASVNRDLRRAREAFRERLEAVDETTSPAGTTDLDTTAHGRAGAGVGEVK